MRESCCCEKWVSLSITYFIENYHEKLEEEYIFPRFEKAGKLVGLVKTLRNQHNVGRRITDNIKLLAKGAFLYRNEKDLKKLSEYLSSYVKMFRVHEARENTELFPEFHNLVTKQEYLKLGEIFEDSEEKLFGKDGFKSILAKVIDIEKKLKINNLAQFTPTLK